MPLARLENFLKNLNGNTLYVDPNELDSTDSIENRGNSRLRPFKTIQRALIEAAVFSYIPGSNNDLFDQTTILIAPGTHYIDNRPGYYVDKSNIIRTVNNNQTTITQLSVTSDFDLGSAFNELYIYNSVEGGVIVPKGVSLVASDLRKTKIKPKFVPDPANNSIKKSAIFRVTGGSYIFGFTIFDGDPIGGVYNTYTTNTVNPTYSHHKLTAFEYADGKNTVTNSNLTDLDTYYYKVSKGFGPFSGRAIPDTFTDLEPNPEENKIVGDLGQGSVDISNLISGDGTVATTTITVTTIQDHGLSPLTPIQISGVGQNLTTETQQQFNGNFVVAQVISPTQFTYLLQESPNAASPDVNGATLTIQSDTVSSSSPYIFNCSLKSVYGLNGLHADGSKATGFKSIVTAQFTGISLQRDDRAFVRYNETSGSYQSQSDIGTSATLHQDSKSLYNPNWESFHIKASNDAFIQCVSIFAIGYAKQFVAESGGDQSITNSNSNFGAISLFSAGFKDFQLNKDNHGFITHIIPPKNADTTENNINCFSIDVSLTTAGSNTTKVYLNGLTDQLTPPDSKVRGYTIGARANDKIYYAGYNGSATISPNYEKIYNVQSISSDIITVEGTLSGISAGQAVRIISKNGILPDGIENNKVYYVSSDDLTSNTIKLRESLSSSSNVVIKNQEGLTPEDNLTLVFRVSDTLPDEVGNPFKFDATVGNWYLNIESNSAFINSLENGEFPTFFIKRRIDSRISDDIVYRIRMVIPKESSNASEPAPGFIIQKSSSTLDSIYSQPNTVSLSSSPNEPITLVRNDGIIIDSWTTTSGVTTTANIVTRRPHGLKVGNKINIYNLRSSNEPSPVGLGTGTGFNGSFVVSQVVSDLQFRYTINRNPGQISSTSASSTQTWLNLRDCSSTTYRTPPYTIDSARRDELPYFTCEKLNNDYQVYKVKTIQKYSENVNDGIYHLYLNVFKNTPTKSPFNVEKYKLSQNLDNIYPEIDVDNIVSDLNSTVSAASRKIIGKVDVNDPRNSTTKESAIKYLEDFGHALKISSISQSGTTSTITTQVDHGLNGIRQLSITNAGSGFSNGTFYDIPLCTNTGSGRGATADVTVSGGQVTSVRVSHPGSGYVQGNTLTIRGIPGSTSAATCSVAAVSPENLGAVQIIGSIYSQNNNTFKINSVTFNTISYTNSLGRSESTTIASAIPNIPAYPISSVGAYNSSENTSQITTTKQHPFLVGNVVTFEGSTVNFTVVSIGSTTFKVVGDVTDNPTLVYFAGLTSQAKDTNTTNENIGSRHIAIPDGFKGRILSALSPTTSSSTIRLSNTDSNSALGLNKGDFIQVNGEIILIDSTSSSTATFIRGVLGTRATSHAANSAFRKINVTPVELRRSSILRASGHTFEYTGFGPGNYSTGMPTNQDRVLSNDEILISQALPTNGGLVVYTGMNSNGEFFIGRKKYDAVTGDELDIVQLPESDVTFIDNVTVNKLTVNGSIDASTATSEFGDITVTGEAIFESTIDVAGEATFESVINANGGLNVSGGDGLVTSEITIDNLTSGRVLLAGTGGQVIDNSNLTYSNSNGLTVGAGGIDVSGVSEFSSTVIVGGDIRINGDDIRNSDNDRVISFDGTDVSIPNGDLVVSGTVTAESDEKIKTNISTIKNALDKVLSLRGVEYDRLDIDDHQIGVIAQEVEKIIPEVVYPKLSESEDQKKSVAYGNLVGLLIEAIKEQNKKIEELYDKINKTDNTLE